MQQSDSSDSDIEEGVGLLDYKDSADYVFKTPKPESTNSSFVEQILNDKMPSVRDFSSQIRKSTDIESTNLLEKSHVKSARKNSNSSEESATSSLS